MYISLTIGCTKKSFPREMKRNAEKKRKRSERRRRKIRKRRKRKKVLKVNSKIFFVKQNKILTHPNINLL